MTKKANIIRSPRGKDRPYFSTNRNTAQDESLSFAARGLLWYLLSKPDNWKVNRVDLQRAGGIGRDKVKRILDELQAAKYLVMERDQDESGKIVWEYRVYEVPYTENTCMVKNEPYTEKPSTVEPCTVNKPTYIKESIQKNETTEKDSSAKPVQPHVAIIDAYWAGLPAVPIGAEYARYVRTAKQLADANITPLDIARYLKAQYRDKFWAGKTITLEYLKQNILAWLKDSKPERPTTPPVEPLTDDELAEARAEMFGISERIT